jgi:hypothetical protein
MTENQFVEIFMLNWATLCRERGIDFKDAPGSNIRMLAHCLARTSIQTERVRLEGLCDALQKLETRYGTKPKN